MNTTTQKIRYEICKLYDEYDLYDEGVNAKGTRGYRDLFLDLIRASYASLDFEDLQKEIDVFNLHCVLDYSDELGLATVNEALVNSGIQARIAKDAGYMDLASAIHAGIFRVFGMRETARCYWPQSIEEINSAWYCFLEGFEEEEEGAC